MTLEVLLSLTQLIVIALGGIVGIGLTYQRLGDLLTVITRHEERLLRLEQGVARIEGSLSGAVTP